MLRAFVLTFHDHTGRQMRDANGRVRGVDVLAAGAGRAIGVDAQIVRIDLDCIDRIDFRQDRDSTGRGMNATLRFGRGHPLHAMCAGFELES